MDIFLGLILKEVKDITSSLFTKIKVYYILGRWLNVMWHGQQVRNILILSTRMWSMLGWSIHILMYLTYVKTIEVPSYPLDYDTLGPGKMKYFTEIETHHKFSSFYILQTYKVWLLVTTNNRRKVKVPTSCNRTLVIIWSRHFFVGRLRTFTITPSISWFSTSSVTPFLSHFFLQCINLNHLLRLNLELYLSYTALLSSEIFSICIYPYEWDCVPSPSDSFRTVSETFCTYVYNLPLFSSGETKSGSTSPNSKSYFWITERDSYLRIGPKFPYYMTRIKVTDCLVVYVHPCWRINDKWWYHLPFGILR